jgi:hypothetical protein
MGHDHSQPKSRRQGRLKLLVLRKMKSLKAILKPLGFGIFLSLQLLISRAAENSARPPLPADVNLNQDAGRGGFIIVTLRLGSGEAVPFVVDSGSPWTLFEKSQESKLGKAVGTETVWNFGAVQESKMYAAPKLYLGKTLLMMTGTNVAAFDFKKLASHDGRPIAGLLGMDVLEHYCIQLDFSAGKMRFLDDERADKKNWGHPFPLTDLGTGCRVVDENLAGVKGTRSEIDTGCDYDGWLTPKLFQQWTNHALLPANGEVRSPNGVLGGETYPGLDLHGTDEKTVLKNDSSTEFQNT